MQTELWGSGPRVVLVHGAITNGPAAWSKQRPLSEDWQLVVVNRSGFAPNPPIPRCDFDVDADELVGLLDEPAHLVGHSYGGLIALLLASRRPEGVRSLTVIEPPVMGLLRGDPAIEEAIASHLALVDTYRDDPREFLAAFTVSLGGDPTNVPETLPPGLRQNVALLINERFPWEATVPTTVLSNADFPKLVVSGGHSAIQERMCDVLATETRARHDTVRGAGHNVQRAPGCNDVLAQFWVDSIDNQP